MRVPVDTLDTKVMLLKILDTETDLQDALNQIIYYDPREKTMISARPIVWLIRNGYIPGESDYKYIQGEKKLENWIQGDCYMDTNYLERNLSMPAYPHHLKYASISGEDLEHCQKSWECTTELLKYSTMQVAKLIQLISET
jgi:hypothetical protein